MTIDKKITYEMQGGIRNYLGKQKTVSNVPLKWKSGPGHPKTELAYITKEEKDLLIKKDLHNSLKNGPNKGPGGIMSLNNDGIGDLGGPGNVGSGGGHGDTGDLGSETANDASLSAGNKSVGYGGPDGDPRTGGGVTTDGPFQRAIDFYNKIPTPFNIVKNVLGNLPNNRNFYDDKVVPAGKTTLGYEDYMSARMAGTIDAYGNPKDTGRGGDNNQSTLNSGIAGIQDINIIGEEVIDPTNTASTQDMNFNFGTFSNPIYKKDLV